MAEARKRDVLKRTEQALFFAVDVDEEGEVKVHGEWNQYYDEIIVKYGGSYDEEAACWVVPAMSEEWEETCIDPRRWLEYDLTMARAELMGRAAAEYDSTVGPPPAKIYKRDCSYDASTEEAVAAPCDEKDWS